MTAEKENSTDKPCLPQAAGAEAGSAQRRAEEKKAASHAPRPERQPIHVFYSDPELADFVANLMETGEFDSMVLTRAAQIATRTEELSISANGENTLNIGDYSSAKRGVFLSTKIQVPCNQAPEERLETWRKETTKLQLLVETQIAAIVSSTMARDGLNNANWHRMFVQIFETCRVRVLKAFGVEPPKTEEAKPQ